MKEGWVCFHRKIAEWEWYTKPGMFHLFSHLVIMANHKDGSWQGIPIKRGQYLTGRKSLSKATGMTEQSIRTCLKRLESTGEISQKSTNRFSVITICKYEDYQDVKKEANQQSTSNQPATNQQLTTNNNVNNENKVKNTNGAYSESFETFWKEYPNKNGKYKAFLSWKKYKCGNGIFKSIMDSLEQQKKSKSWLDDDGKYIPNGSTWVHGRRWEDNEATTPQSDCTICDIRRRGICKQSKNNCSQFEEFKI